MDVALQGIISENTGYYLKRKRMLASALLGIPKGSLKSKKSGAGTYYYLHMREGDKTSDVYLGRADEDMIHRLREEFELKRRLKKEITIARKSLRLLGVRNAMIDREDFIDPIRRVFQELDMLGLWEAGLELIGSWCFKVYQNYLGVERYPLRTLDIDIAIPVPYKGPEADLGDLLKDLGFQVDFRPNGAMYYVGFGMIIELISPDKGRGANDGRIHIEKLHISALALRYIDILLENGTSILIHGVGRISIPSMSAFMLHKLLVAPLRSDAAKKAKDYRQVHSIAKRIFPDESLMKETARILQKMPRRWSSRIAASAKAMKEHLPEDEQNEVTSMLIARASFMGS